MLLFPKQIEQTYNRLKEIIELKIVHNHWLLKYPKGSSNNKYMDYFKQAMGYDYNPDNPYWPMLSGNTIAEINWKHIKEWHNFDP